MNNKKRLFSYFIEFKKDDIHEKDVSEILLSYPRMRLVDIRNALSSLGFESIHLDISFKNIEREALPCFIIINENIDNYCKDGDLLIYSYDDGKKEYYLLNSKGQRKDLSKTSHININSAILVKRRVLISSDDKENTVNNISKNEKKWMIKFFFRFRENINSLYLLTLISTCSILVIPYYIYFIHENYLITRDSLTLINASTGVVIVLAIDYGIRNIRSSIIAWTSSRVNYLLKTELFRQMINFKDANIEKEHININLYEQINRMTRFFGSNTTAQILDLLFVPLFLIPLVIISWKMALPILIMSPFYFLHYKRHHRNLRIAKTLFQNISKQRMILTNELKRRSESIFFENILPIFNKRLTSMTAGSALHDLKCEMLIFKYAIHFYVLSFITIILCLTIGINQYWNQDLSISKLLASISLIIFIFLPINRYLTNRNSNLSSRKVLKDIHIELIKDIEKRSLYSLEDLYLKSLDLRFTQVSYTNPITLIPLLKNINLCLRHGKIFGIDGDHNTGKDILIKLINKTYMPHTGTITIGNVDHRQADTMYLRQRLITLNLTKSLLKNLSIFENIKYINPLITKKEILISMEIFGLNKMLKDSDLTIDTPLNGPHNYKISKELYAATVLLIPFTTRAKIVLIEEIPSSIINESLPMLRKFINIARNNFTVIFKSDHFEILKECDEVLYLTRDAKIITKNKATLLKESYIKVVQNGDLNDQKKIYINS
ncbi:ATP-binding cassette domain-containing protein [Halobacteriovorax sp.]|uniref:ATP-binding cassette domain-containing protein n=1 Tax=Halobacteriovorax sp. TaxID=2020862 RepID=UPI003AF3149E